MFGNGGNDTLYRSDGRTFDSLDDSVAGDAWKQYARSTNKVWYVGASNVDDIIKVDFVTEPGLLAEHHLITRQTSNGENVTFDATVRLDFAATDTGGNSIWDAKDILLDLDRLMTADPRDRQDALGELANAERQLVNNLLPPEGDFLAIIIDALDGNDEITIGPTVQKTVWVDGGAGNDTIKILSGNAILIDQTEFESRNDDAATAYLLGQQAAILAARAAPADGRITRNATFSLQLVNDPGAAVDLAPTVEIKLAATATLDNRDSNDLAKDLNDALAAAGLGDEVGARADGARMALFTRDAGASNQLRLVTSATDAASTALGFDDGQTGAGNVLSGNVVFKGLTLDSPDDVDHYAFTLASTPGPEFDIRLRSVSPNDRIELEVLTIDLTPVNDLGALQAGVQYLLRVTDNRIPTIYDLEFDFGDGGEPVEVELAANPHVIRRDVLLGGAGNDVLIGGQGDDWVFGGEGNDVLSGGADRQNSDLLYGGPGDDIFQIIPDALPFINGTEQTLIPTLSDQMFGGEGEDQVQFLGGDLDAAGQPVPDSVSIRYNRFLQRYEFTSLVWDTANQEFVRAEQARPALVTASNDAPLTGQLAADANFQVVLDDALIFDVTVTAAATGENDSIVDLLDDIRAALVAAGAQVAFTEADEATAQVRVDQDDGRIRLVRLATGSGAAIEVVSAGVVDLKDGTAPLDELGFQARQRGDGGVSLFEQHFLFYQTDDIERTVINTRSGDDVTHGDPEFKFPNTDSEYGIDLGDREQGGTLSALTILGGPGADRLFGTPLDDFIDGGPGADVILGGSGNDEILGGGAADLLFGNTGISPDDLELVSRGGTTGRNDTFDFAAGSPDVVPGLTGETFDDLILSLHLGDPADWYTIKTPEAFKRFGSAEVAALFEQMITARVLLPVNEVLTPVDGATGELPFRLFAAVDTDAGPAVALAPAEEFAGVPDFYLLKVENPDTDDPRQYRIEFGPELGRINDISGANADLQLTSADVGAQAIAIALGDIDGDGFDEFISAAVDELGSPLDLFNAPLGTHPASVIGDTTVTINFSRTGDTVELKLPAPVVQNSRFGSRAVIAEAGDYNGDGLTDIAVAVSIQDRGALGDGTFSDEGVYILFGRENWQSTPVVDLVADADVVIKGFEPGAPLRVASGGAIDGDKFDALLVSVGGHDPAVHVFKGREQWTSTVELLAADFSYANSEQPSVTPTGDGDLQFANRQLNLPGALLDNQTDVTVEFWLRTADATDQAILSAAGARADNELLLFLLNNRTLRVFNEGLVHDFDVFINVADDAWHHYSVVRGQSSSSLSLYVDGALIEKKTAIPMTALQVAGNGLLLGQDQDTIGGGFQSFQA